MAVSLDGRKAVVFPNPDFRRSFRKTVSDSQVGDTGRIDKPKDVKKNWID